MKSSLVLIVNLTPTCTELARHLVLSGINFRLIGSKNKIIDANDTESDFLFTQDDLGKSVSFDHRLIIFIQRAEIVKAKLLEVNTFVKIEFQQNEDDLLS